MADMIGERGLNAVEKRGTADISYNARECHFLRRDRWKQGL